MNSLINIKVNENQEQTVSGRELHTFLGIETPYTKWFERMCEYGFIERQDFWTKMSESTGGRPSTDHTIKIDMAKELCMLSRNAKGKQARQYFLEIERDWNTPDKVMARALILSQNKLKETVTIVAEQAKHLEAAKSKVIFADAVSVAKTAILIGDLAKILKQNGFNTGQKRLFQWMRENGYLIKRQGSDYNSPTQRAMELGLFEIKETAITHSDGHVTISKTTKVTGRGQVYFVNLVIGTKESA